MSYTTLPKTSFDHALDLIIKVGVRTAFSAFAVKLIFRGNRV